MAGLAGAAAELEALAFRLRRAGDTDLVREVTRAMRDAVDPAQDQIRAGLDPHLPKRYAAELDADLQLSVNVRTNERNPGVALTATTRSGRGRKLRNLDAGELTHPLFGDRSEWTHAPRQVEHQLWFTQKLPSVQPRFFTGPAEAAGPRVRAGIERALKDVSDKATKGP